MSRYVSEALSKAHDRSRFSSGNARIDAFFQTAVSQDVKRRYAVCYVLCERAGGRIAGFYTLSSSHIPLAEVPPDLAAKLPRYPSVPAVLIGWLARDAAFAGGKIGEMLLYDAIARVASAPIGAHAVFAEAVDEAAASFYRAHDFTPLLGRPLCLFLPMATAVKLAGAQR